MASAVLKLIVLSVCLNTFLYLGVNYAMFGSDVPQFIPSQQKDLFQLLLEDKGGFDENLHAWQDNLNSSEEWSGTSNLDIAENFSTVPDPESGAAIQPEFGGFAFIDAVRMVFAGLVTLWRITFIPLLLFSYNLLPPVAAIIIGIPLFILNWASLIIFLRGGGAP